MHRVLRLFIAFLVAAAVPLQGIAAVAMAACGPEHLALSHSESMSHMHHSDRMSHDHRLPSSEASVHSAMHHDESASFDEDTRIASHAAHASLDKQPKSKCSVCAFCCAAAAMPSASIGFSSVALMEFFAPPVSIGVPAFLTSGLERPPRFFLA